MPVIREVFRWTEVYRVNVGVLDQQHRELFDAVNELEKGLRGGEGSASIHRVLDKLVNYAGLHFATEEALMLQHNFPGLPLHRAEHDAFRTKISKFLEDHRAGKTGVPVQALLYMQEWLKHHLLKTDKRYSAFLNARGVR